MGADFCLVSSPLPIVAEGETINDDERAALLQRRINSLSEEVLLDLADWFLGTLEIDEEGQWRQTAFDRLRECLAFLEEGGSRETATLSFEGREWMFAGGMSSGDTPTKAFDDLWLLAVVGITYEPLRKLVPIEETEPPDPGPSPDA